MCSSNSPTPLTKEKLEALSRSNVRQLTRSGLGAVISSGLAGSGLVYMAAPAGVAAYGFTKSMKARIQLEQIMQSRGFRARKRDLAYGVLVGSAEKLTLSFLLLGHDEIAFLGEHQGLDADVVQAHNDWLAAGGDGLIINDEGQVQPDHGAIGDGNVAYNALVDEIKTDFNVEGGMPETAEQVVGNVLAGGAAAGIEYATNRVGHAGRVARTEHEMPGTFDGKQGKKKREDLGV
ncbi:hypothetical protein BKA66DRAFT_568963 [Pyrenochaeta sp. MPI-SDFR-AT-0127]|nr:hypothetical protein BKA66DRAFT_568963 [Pyrenochaeta sp. MPI-SDFR-AT-0127]